MTTLVFAGLLVSCKADKVKSSDVKNDAGVEIILEPPVLNVIPSATPNTTVAIRGTSNGKRVVIQGGASGTSISSVLPGGSFCEDILLKPSEATTLTIFAMGDGLLSVATKIVVTHDATSPAPSSPTCGGTSLPDCDLPEICDNEKDDNCDGWIDHCDRECNQCQDDNFEPNDFAMNVPLIAKGSYALTICPCRDDWFAFERKAGQRIKVTADFNHASLPINLRLFKATPSGGQGDFLGGSFSNTNQEVINKTVDESTLYLVRVYAFGSDEQSGPYQLTID